MVDLILCMPNKKRHQASVSMYTRWMIAVVFYSWKQQLAPSMTPTCLTALPTLSTSMTLPRRRRRTWNNPHLTCSTRLKRRSVRSPQSLSSVIQCCWCLVWLCIPLVPALCQIFKLMKMDSYRRFVRSPLYQSCTLASVEGKPLPQPARLGSWEDVVTRSPSLSDKKVELKWNRGGTERKNMWFDLILI